MDSICAHCQNIANKNVGSSLLNKEIKCRWIDFFYMNEKWNGLELSGIRTNVKLISIQNNGLSIKIDLYNYFVQLFTTVKEPDVSFEFSMLS